MSRTRRSGRGGIALVLVVLCLAGVAAAAPSPADLEAEIVCPTCKTTLDQSSSPIANRMKAFIRERLAAGDSSDEIKAQLVAQFGPAVLAEPPKRGFDLLAWLVPIGAIAVGALAVILLSRAWARSGRGEPGGESPLDPELERRIDAELARFDE